MKKTFTMCLALLCSFYMNAEITYTNYGDGWVIPMNAQQELDIDGDGIVDLYVNQEENELGLSAVFAVGCISSPGASDVHDYGAYKLLVFEEGDEIQVNSANFYDYIDDGRGSAYHNTEGYAEGFEAEKDVYLGFLLMKGTKVQNGWMQVEIDADSETLIIKGIAYGEEVNQGDPGIIAGDTGLSTVGINDLSDEILELSVAPNPAQDFFHVSFEYNVTDALSINVYNTIGQLVENISVAKDQGKYNLLVNTSNWDSGIYYLRLQSITGVRTQKVFIQ